jgi:hypothetical protein
MAEPGTAKAGPETANDVTILWTSGSGYSPIPATLTVPVGGTVTFISNYACWVWTMVNNVLVNAFQGQTNDYLNCSTPGSNTFTTTEPANTVITIIPLAVNSNPPTPLKTENLRGTIRVGSGEHDEHDKR